MPVMNALIIAASGILVVFLMLVLLWMIIVGINKTVIAIEKTEEKPAEKAVKARPVPVQEIKPAPAPAAAPAPAYIGYSPTCGACAPFTPVGIENAPSPQQLQGAYESAAPVAPAPAAAPAVDDKPIDTAQLNAMIDSMVKALKGE